MPGSQWCVFTVGTFGIVRCYIHIRRWASALLVSMDRALPEPQNVKRATESGFTSFLFILTTRSPWSLKMKHTHGQECIGGQNKEYRRTDQR